MQSSCRDGEAQERPKKISAHAWARHCVDPSSLEQGVPKRRGRGKFVMCAPIGHMAIAEN